VPLHFHEPACRILNGDRQRGDGEKERGREEGKKEPSSRFFLFFLYLFSLSHLNSLYAQTELLAIL